MSGYSGFRFDKFQVSSNPKVSGVPRVSKISVFSIFHAFYNFHLLYWFPLSESRRDDIIIE